MVGMRESPSPAGAVVDSLLNRHQVGADAVLAVLLALPLGLVSLSLLRASDSPVPLRLLAGAGLLVLHGCVVTPGERQAPGPIEAPRSGP
ncbi:hypothetical protein GCM10023334_034030 [Nonomuraea thailandensis]